MTYRIAHISDLHFHSLSLHPKHWMGKRMLGGINLLLNRRRHYPLANAQRLVEKLQTMSFDHLLITGDLTTLGLEAEFALARQTLAPLLKDASEVTVIPGNHDRYVPECLHPDLFQQYFGEFFTTEEILTKKLHQRWQLIAWDSTHPNPYLSANGTVRRQTLGATDSHMQSQPVDTLYLVANHYPVWFPDYRTIHLDHELYNLGVVRHWLETRPKVRAYLHGHIHHNWLLPIKREQGALMVINSASSTRKVSESDTSFHLVELHAEHVSASAHRV